MPFRPEDLHDLDTAREVRIETHGDHGVVHSTIIWVIVDNGQVFVRSVRGTTARWYREAIGTADVTIDDEGRRLEARAIPVHDEDSIHRVTAALQRKYADDAEGLASMITPDVLDATFRLEPRRDDEVPLEAPAYLGIDDQSELGPPVEIGMLDAGPAIDENVILQPHKPV